MAINEHFQRLRHIYSSKPSTPDGDRVNLSYGHAELDAWLEVTDRDAILTRLPHHRLLSDVAALAAGSVEKDRRMDAEQFTVTVEEPDHEGPVVASADVVLAEPPRYVVYAMLLSESGDLVAEATGVYRPGDKTLPPDPAPEKGTDERSSHPEPASFMPVHTTPFGMVCLN